MSRPIESLQFRVFQTLLALVVFLALGVICEAQEKATLKIGLFELDATPPVGSPLAYNPMERKGSTLWLKGIVFVGNEKPIVLVSVDWIGIGGEGHRSFRESIAEAVGTTAERVALHCLHQHDAPRYDSGAERLLAAEGLAGRMYNEAFARRTIKKTCEAAKQALSNAKPVTHVGLGQAKVEKVASNRRILGEDGKVQHVRWTATRDPKVRAYPEGVIDPFLKSFAFYSNERLLAVVTYYATHPQSYYRTGAADTDFPGMARQSRQKETGVPHIHFNGAGGNIGAGKYNDGSHENRPVLANRVAKGMKDALKATKKFPVTAESLGWAIVKVSLPVADHLDEKSLVDKLKDRSAKPQVRISAAKALSFLRRTKSGEQTEISCLKLGGSRVIHMPGELFVEYQLNAAKMRPGRFVAMAAYGDYAPGYIGTKISYKQGGYETSPRASRVAPSVEAVLMRAVQQLLDVPDTAQ